MCPATLTYLLISSCFYYTGLAVLKRILYKEHEYELRVELEDWEGNTAYAKYNRFWIGDYTVNYVLTAMLYDGTAGKYDFDLSKLRSSWSTPSSNHMEKISSLVADRCTTILLWALIGKF